MIGVAHALRITQARQIVILVFTLVSAPLSEFLLIFKVQLMTRLVVLMMGCCSILPQRVGTARNLLTRMILGYIQIEYLLVDANDDAHEFTH